MNIKTWLLIRISHARIEIQVSTEKTKKSIIRYIYQRPGTTNHPHHLGTDVAFFLPLLEDTIINQYSIPPPPLDCSFAFHILVDGVVADVCCWFFFIWDCCWPLFCTYMVFNQGYFVLAWWPTPTDLYPPTMKGFALSDANLVTLKCWWVVGGVGWTTFRDSPYESVWWPR